MQAALAFQNLPGFNDMRWHDAQPPKSAIGNGYTDADIALAQRRHTSFSQEILPPGDLTTSDKIHRLNLAKCNSHSQLRFQTPGFFFLKTLWFERERIGEESPVHHSKRFPWEEGWVGFICGAGRWKLPGTCSVSAVLCLPLLDTFKTQLAYSKIIQPANSRLLEETDYLGDAPILPFISP